MIIFKKINVSIKNKIVYIGIVGLSDSIYTLKKLINAHGANFNMLNY